MRPLKMERIFSGIRLERKVFTSKANLMLGLASGLVLSGILPLMLLNDTINSSRSEAWILTTIVMIVSGIRLSFLIAFARPRLFEFITWLFSYVFFGLAATVQLRSGDMAGTTPNLDPSLDTPAAIMVIVGLLSLLAGITFARRKTSKKRAIYRSYEVSESRANILMVIGIGCAVYYMSKIGFDNFLKSRENFNLILSSNWPDVSTLAMVKAMAIYPLLVASHAIFIAKTNVSGHSSKKGVRRIKGIIAAVIVMFITNPISTARYVFGSVWGGYLLPLGAYASRIRTSISMLVIVFGLLFIFPIADVFRYTRDSTVSRSSFFGEYAGNGDYDAFGQISNTLSYIDDRGITWGNQFLGVVLFWIPRGIWSDKAQDTGVLLGEYRGYGFTNLSAPLWSESLINFGVVGLIVVFLLFGVLVGRLDLAGTLALSRGSFALLPMAILPFYLLIVLRGSLLQATGSFVVMVLCMYFVRGKENPRLRSSDSRSS